MAFANVYASLLVEDLDRAVEWQSRFFDRGPDRIPMEGLAEWQITEAGGLQVFRDPPNAGRSGMTLVVDDLDQRVGALKRRGIEPGAVQSGDYVRFSMLNDPDGNRIVLAEPSA